MIPQETDSVNRKNSLSEKTPDTVYLAAVERGDMETAQHTTVTVFEADSVRNGLPFDYAEYLLKNESNIEMDLDVDTKQENPKLETAYGETLATASKEEFSKDSIPQPKNHVNRKYSLSEKTSGTAYLTAVEHGVGTGVLDRPKKGKGAQKITPRNRGVTCLFRLVIRSHGHGGRPPER